MFSTPDLWVDCVLNSHQYLQECNEELKCVWYVCWWFIASPQRLSLNCSTRVLVSVSLWWMDSCQHDADILSLVFSSVWMCFNSSSLTPSSCACSHVFFSLTLLCFLSLLFLPHLISLTFLLSLSSPRLCSRLSARATCGRRWEQKATVTRRKTAPWQKLPPPSSLVAAKKKECINYLNDWMMLAQLRGCILCWDECCSSAQRRFLLVFVFCLCSHTISNYSTVLPSDSGCQSYITEICSAMQQHLNRNGLLYESDSEYQLLEKQDGTESAKWGQRCRDLFYCVSTSFGEDSNTG